MHEVEIKNYDAMHKSLSDKEIKCLSSFAEHFTYDGVSSDLNRSTETVKTHLKNARWKLAVDSTYKAVALAVAKGWIVLKEVDAKVVLAIFLTFSSSAVINDDELVRLAGHKLNTKINISRTRNA